MQNVCKVPAETEWVYFKIFLAIIRQPDLILSLLFGGEKITISSSVEISFYLSLFIEIPSYVFI